MDGKERKEHRAGASWAFQNRSCGTKCLDQTMMRNGLAGGRASGAWRRNALWQTASIFCRRQWETVVRRCANAGWTGLLQLRVSTTTRRDAVRGQEGLRWCQAGALLEARLAGGPWARELSAGGSCSPPLGRGFPWLSGSRSIRN